MKKIKLSICFLIIFSFLAFVEAQEIKVAAVQMKADSIDVNKSLKKAEYFIRMAFEQGAKLVVLPESFTIQFTARDFDLNVVDAIRTLEGEPLQLFKNLAKEYEGVIGGSYLAYKSGSIYNSFVLVFPNGNYFVHNKDYPTFGEGCYYTNGSDDGVFNTPIGRIGIALCYEINRTETVRRMLGRVDLVLVASAWPGPNPQDYQNNESLELLKKSSETFSKLLGVPVVHSNQVGKVNNVNFTPVMNLDFSFVGGSRIINSVGEVTKELTFQDGEGIILDTINLTKDPKPTVPISNNFWIYEISGEQAWFESLFGPYRDFYEESVRKQLIKKYLHQR